VAELCKVRFYPEVPSSNFGPQVSCGFLQSIQANVVMAQNRKLTTLTPSTVFLTAAGILTKTYAHW
jgi:hypothetical protein